MTHPLRIAYFSPLPPAHTGIADYSRELLPELARRAEITLFVENPQEVDASSLPPLPILPIDLYAIHRWDYDVALYQMGNSVHHIPLYQTFLRYPGIVALHDYGLHHFMYARTVGTGSWAGYSREMGYALGVEGIRWAREIWQSKQPPPYFASPLSDRVLDLALGLIVHSQQGHQRVLRRSPTLPSTVIPAPIASYSVPTGRRRDLGWPAEAVIFASLGQVTAAKCIDQALQAFASLRQNVPQSFFLIVGEWSSEEIDLPAVVGRLGLEEAVHCTGYVEDMAEFVSWIATADVVVNLRNPTVGETSATALRALAAGRPLIVFDHGWYAELPDDACLKVAPDDQDGLVAAMSRLATDESRRQEMGRRAGIYATEVHAPARAAAAYIDFIASVLTGVECGPSRPLD